MEISNGVKRRFTKDTGIPIHVFDEPYFSYFLDLFDPMYGSRSKFELLTSALAALGSEEAYFFESDRIIKEVLNDISVTDGYKKFNATKTASDLVGVSRRNLYTADHVGQSFISIDMREANFQCLHKFDANIFNGASTYQEYIQRFTQIPYFIKSKHLRQVIFGNLNPKRQQVFQRIMMEAVTTPLRNDLGINSNDLFFLSSDELIVRYRHGTHYDINEAREYVDRMAMSLCKHAVDCNDFVRVSIELFDVHKVYPHDMFIKHIRIHDQRKTTLSWEDPNRIVFRLVPAHFVPQLIRYVDGSVLTDADLLFYYERMLCRFLNPLHFDVPFIDLIGGDKQCR